MNKPNVEIYTRDWCGYCRMALALLNKHGIEYQQYEVNGDAEKETEMKQRSGRHTVPQIFINDKAIGGFTDLASLSMKTDLNEYVNNTLPRAE